MQIFHNSRCGKSRNAIQFFESHGFKLELIEYLKNPPTISRLKEIITKSGIKVEDFVRKSEAEFKETPNNTDLNDAQLIELMVLHPILIQRPIVISEKGIWIARTDEKLQEILHILQAK